MDLTISWFEICTQLECIFQQKLTLLIEFPYFTRNYAVLPEICQIEKGLILVALQLCSVTLTDIKKNLELECASSK